MKSINWEHYYKEVEKLDEEYRNKPIKFVSSQGRLDLDYLKRRVDLLQLETYTVFPTDINYYIALLQTTLADGLVFEYVGTGTPECVIEEEIEQGKFTISDLKNLIKELQSLSKRCSGLSKSNKYMIDTLSYEIFEQCCYLIKKIFLIENDNLPLEKMKELDDTLYIEHYDGDYIRENYSLHAIELFKSYHTKWTINEILVKELKARNEKGLNSLIDVNLICGTIDCDLEVEHIWHFSQLDKNNWKYYQFALEYLRTILVQIISEGLVDDEEFTGIIMARIAEGIIFCMTKGKNTDIDYLDNIDVAPLCRKEDYDTSKPIISQYFYDNLEYILNSFKASEAFSHSEKNNMTSYINSIYEVMPIYNI